MFAVFFKKTMVILGRHLKCQSNNIPNLSIQKQAQFVIVENVHVSTTW